MHSEGCDGMVIGGNILKDRMYFDDKFGWRINYLFFDEFDGFVGDCFIFKKTKWLISERMFLFIDLKSKLQKYPFSDCEWLQQNGMKYQSYFGLNLCYWIPMK